MVPDSPLRLEMRRLSSLPDELVQLGRVSGLFTNTQAVSSGFTDEVVAALTDQTRGSDGAGLAVTRAGQRSAWVTLPHDGLGSVLDPAEVESRTAALLDLLCRLPVETPRSVGFALKVEPTLSLTIGSADILGQRSSATMSFALRSPEGVAADDTLDFTAVSAATPAVAEELIARLLANLRSG
jgi:hypothetical protein